MACSICRNYVENPPEFLQNKKTHTCYCGEKWFRRKQVWKKSIIKDNKKAPNIFNRS